MQETQEDSLEKEMATHSSNLAWEILWTEEPGREQSTVSQRVGHNLATKQQQQQTTPLWESAIRQPEKIGLNGL